MKEDLALRGRKKSSTKAITMYVTQRGGGGEEDARRRSEKWIDSKKNEKKNKTEDAKTT